MNLSQQIDADYLAAYKAKKEAEISVLRLLKTALKNEQINVSGAKMEELADSAVEKVVKTEVKKRNDAITDYEKAGRQDLADKEKSEIVILEKYLPKQLSQEQISALIDEVLAGASDADKANMGKMMGAVMKAVGNSADGNLVKTILQQKLAK